MLKTIQTVEAHHKRLLREILLPGQLEIILVIFWQSLAACCLCPKNPLEADLEGFELISLAKDISRQPSINCATWLLAAVL